MNMLGLSFISVCLSWEGHLQPHLALRHREVILSFPLRCGSSWLLLPGLGTPRQSHQSALLSHASGGTAGWQHLDSEQSNGDKWRLHSAVRLV